MNVFQITNREEPTAPSEWSVEFNHPGLLWGSKGVLSLLHPGPRSTRLYKQGSSHLTGVLITVTGMKRLTNWLQDETICYGLFVILFRRALSDMHVGAQRTSSSISVPKTEDNHLGSDLDSVWLSAYRPQENSTVMMRYNERPISTFPNVLSIRSHDVTMITYSLSCITCRNGRSLLIESGIEERKQLLK